MATQIRNQNTGDLILEALRQEIINTAEPLIVEALADMEKELRKKMAMYACALVSSDFSVRRMGERHSSLNS